MQTGEIGAAFRPGPRGVSTTAMGQIQPGQHQHGLLPGQPPGQGLRDHQIRRRHPGQGGQALRLRLQQRQPVSAVGFGKEAAVARRPQAPGAVNAATPHGSAGHQLDSEPLLQPIGQRVNRGANHRRGDGGLRTRKKL